MKKLLLIIHSCIVITGLFAQGTLNINSGTTINDYFIVDSVFNDSNRVVINNSDNPTLLLPGDKVMLVQMTGVEIDNFDIYTSRSSAELQFRNTGKYELLAVSRVLQDSIIEFSAKFINSYDSLEKVQLVKLYEGERVVVENDIEVYPWNGDKGGVLGIVGYKSVDLQGGIVATGSGFRGGDSLFTTENCRDTMPGAIDTMYFENADSKVAAYKGEGNLSVDFNFLLGGGHAANGGGSGHGKNAGGGGGSLGNKGGDPSNQYGKNAYCKDLDFSQLSGGVNVNTKYVGTRLGFGGGGGGGTSTIEGGATSGGNGGGIILIVTDSLFGGDNKLESDGNSALTVMEPTTPGGGGGGGAGGLVAVDALYVDSLKLYVRGGDGASIGIGGGAGVIGPIPGSSGSGGVLYSSKPTSQFNEVDFRADAGDPGYNNSHEDIAGSKGGEGKQETDFSALINGFVFNSVYGIAHICENEKPDTIIATLPRIAQEHYFEFEWIQSENNQVDWQPAVSDNGQGVDWDTTYFLPSAMDDTLWFARVVKVYDIITDSTIVSDTSIAVKVTVTPLIENNVLQLRDTICYGGSPGILDASTPTGGDDAYYYKWEKYSVGDNQWDSVGNQRLYDDVNPDSTDSYYKRFIMSAGVCFDTSEVDTLTVLPAITDNEFTRGLDTTVCQGLETGLLSALQPGGGDGQYRYNWIRSTDDENYDLINDSVNKDLSPGIVTSSYYYKRIVLSGSDNVCVDTTAETVLVSMVDSIQNNQLLTDSSRYCYYNEPRLIYDNSTSGGTGSYVFTWYSRTLGSGWIEIIGEENGTYQPDVYTDSIYLRRRVKSGDLDACIDMSDSIRIDVIPTITNVLQSPDTIICEGQKSVAFTEVEATGASGAFTYLWIDSVSGNNWNAASTDEGPNTLASYSSTNLNSSTYFKRVAISEICADTSNFITNTVLSAIDNNLIEGGSLLYTCYNTTRLLTGSDAIFDPSAVNRYKWEQSTDASSWDSVSSTTSYTSPELTVTNYFRRIAFAGDYDQCKDTVTTQVEINALPTSAITNTNSIKQCIGSNIDVDYTFTGASPWIVVVNNATAQGFKDTVDFSTGTITVPVVDSTMVQFWEVVDDSSCYADTSLDNSFIPLTAYKVPIANQGYYNDTCGLQSYHKIIPSIQNSDEWSVDWIVDFGNEQELDSETYLITSASYGNQQIKYIERNWQCYDTATFSVHYYEQPLKENISAGPAYTEKNFAFYDFMKAEPVQENFNARWFSVPDVYSIEDSTSPTTRVDFYADQVQTYQMIWEVSNGVCVAIFDTAVYDILDLDIQEGFSPNGDPYNPTFNILLGGNNDVEFIVLNQYGKEVYKTIERIEISWDGKSNDGDELPAGVYFYIIKESGLKDRTGFLELRK